MTEFKKGDLVKVTGRTETLRVENVGEFYLGLVRLDPAALPTETGVHIAVPKDDATVIGFRGTGPDSDASPASGATVTNL